MAFDDARRFNVKGLNGLLLCPACGWPGAFLARALPYDAAGGVIGRGICACCLFEPGFDDDPRASAEAEPTVEASIRKYRAAWMRDGMRWRGDARAPAPPAWDPRGQLALLFACAPELA